MNDQANEVACAQQDCSGGSPICPDSKEPCIFTICLFDKNEPIGRPYVKSVKEGASCTAKTCKSASDPSKTECVNHLCCAGEAARNHEL